MKKKLLILSSDFQLETGGVANTSYLFAEYFQPYMDVITFCPSDGISPNISGVVNYRGKYARNNILFTIESCFKIFSIYKKHQFDYVLSTRYGNAPSCILLKWRYGIPFGVLCHGQEVIKWRKGGLLGTIKGNIYYPIRALVLKFATHIFANTNFTKGLVKRLTNNRNITVINPPICLKKQTKDISIRKTPILLTIGRLDVRKGFQNVVKALPKVLQVKPDIKYIIAGMGPYETELKNLVSSLHLQESVDFKGKVSEEEKCELIEKCSIFLMPSITIKNDSVEGFGLSLLEANLYGKFVISTFSGGIPEAVEDGKTGFLVEENNVNALADAIIRFYDERFTYNPKECVEWASKRHITEIVKQYMIQISKVL